MPATTTPAVPEHHVEIPVRALAGAAVLVAVGSLIALGGIAIGTGVAAITVRRWVQQHDSRPSRMARHKLRQFSSAASASVHAWRAPDQPA